MIKKEIGFAGDLMQPSLKYMHLTGGFSEASKKLLVTLCDLFVLHDKVYFRADAMTLREIFGAMTIDELNSLIENNRIGFYKAYFLRDGAFPGEEDKIGEGLSRLKSTFYEDNFNVSRAEKLVIDNLILPKTEEKFQAFRDSMFDLFYNNELLKDQFIHMDRQIGFEAGISRTRELWQCGITAINYDWEIHNYFDICNKAAFFKKKELNVCLENPEKSMIEDLHKFKNLPSVAELIVKSENPTKLFLEITNSHETADFRNWIQSIDIGNLDIRDAYEKELRLLPSKSKWVDWVRFGSVSVISSILGTIITSNPYLGFLIGTGISTVDKVYGDDVIDLATPNYKPDSWSSFIESKLE